MGGPDRNNPYGFDEYLKWREGFDYYLDDPFVQKVGRHFAGDDWDQVDQAARELSPKVSYRWRDVAERIARPAKHPFLTHFDGHNHRIDRVERPHELELMEREVFSEALFSDATPRWVRLMKMFLIYQNGEACTSCPVTCTEGLVALLDQLGESPQVKQALQHCKEGIDGDFGVGAQFLTEIQGGSDVPANLVEAVQGDDGWRLYGKKYFCSVAHADYAVVTAKPTGSEDVAVFLLPMWLPGDKARERRNGHTIDRLKWKMGTCELPTAEINFDGALAYPVGPLERGLANVVGVVLTYSRMTVGLSAAAMMTRAAREAIKYAEFRTAFGQPIARYPLTANQLRWLERSANRSTAGAFKLYSQVLQLPDGLRGGLASNEPEQLRRQRFRVRELIMLQKMVASWDATDVLRMAMSLMGGHGVMEDFTALPRLFRDAAINELWEGPRNLLLTQIHRDCQRVIEWYPPRELVADLLDGAEAATVDTLGKEMAELLSHGSLLKLDDATLAVCERWDRFCNELCHAYQDLALAQVNA